MCGCVCTHVWLYVLILFLKIHTITQYVQKKYEKQASFVPGKTLWSAPAAASCAADRKGAVPGPADAALGAIKTLGSTGACKTGIAEEISGFHPDALSSSFSFCGPGGLGFRVWGFGLGYTVSGLEVGER